MDTNGDGVLSFEEVTSGLSEMFGEDREELNAIAAIFKNLDLDGSLFVDYTEFCAAALGAKIYHREEVVWAAFKTFDVDSSGAVSVGDLQKVLEHADMQHHWSPEVCAQASEALVREFDQDGDGQITFEEWKVMMKRCSDGQAPGFHSEGGVETSFMMDGGSGIDVYRMLMDVDFQNGEESPAAGDAEPDGCIE